MSGFFTGVIMYGLLTLAVVAALALMVGVCYGIWRGVLWLLGMRQGE